MTDGVKAEQRFMQLGFAAIEIGEPLRSRAFAEVRKKRPSHIVQFSWVVYLVISERDDRIPGGLQLRPSCAVLAKLRSARMVLIAIVFKDEPLGIPTVIGITSHRATLALDLNKLVCLWFRQPMPSILWRKEQQGGNASFGRGGGIFQCVWQDAAHLSDTVHARGGVNVTLRFIMSGKGPSFND